MNRWLSMLLLLLLLFLLVACGQVEVPPDNAPSLDQNIDVNPGSAEQNEPDIPEELDKPEESSEPAENASPEFQDLSWVVPQSVKMSYEEYFSEDRPYFNDFNSWLIFDGQSWKGYTLEFDYGCGLQVVLWDDSQFEDVAVYTVPDTVDLDMFELLGTDGTTAYLTPYSETKDSILAVDLLTGSREYIVQDAVITSVRYCGDVLYYALYKDDMMQIVRRYLPTGDELYYPTGQKLAPMFSFYAPQSSSDSITWVGVTEKMTSAVIKELQNANSSYRTGDRVPPYLWEMEEPWIYADRNPIYWLCYELQKTKDYRTLYKCTMGSDGSVISKATGIVDSCWYGSDMSHDHYHPDAKAPKKPVADMGAWIPFVNAMTGSGEPNAQANLEIYQNRLYTTAGNTFTLLTDVPIRSLYMTEADWGDSMNACYGITTDDQLVRLYLDGSTPAVLYQGTNIRSICSSEDCMVILDEDQVIQLDLANQQFRTVLHHENILRMYFEVDSVDMLYFEMNRGLHSTGYLFNLVTGEATEVGYRL